MAGFDIVKSHDTDGIHRRNLRERSDFFVDRVRGHLRQTTWYLKVWMEKGTVQIGL